jgi:hypothetical protein
MDVSFYVAILSLYVHYSINKERINTIQQKIVQVTFMQDQKKTKKTKLK